jgi:hypothetical protein
VHDASERLLADPPPDLRKSVDYSSGWWAERKSWKAAKAHSKRERVRESTSVRRNTVSTYQRSAREGAATAFKDQLRQVVRENNNSTQAAEKRLDLVVHLHI